MSKNPYLDLTSIERMQLAGDLRDGVDPETADWPLTDAQRAELERRLEEDEAELDGDEEWGVFRDEMLRKLGAPEDDPRCGGV